jgi:LysR family transcriptional activator of mexEF-oprN operon
MNSDINQTTSQTLDLNLLLVFEALMQEHSVTRAAGRLGVTQAAVSASLRRLRTAYGGPLFMRGQRGLTPTPQAILLQPMIEEALALVRRSLDQASGQTDAAAPQIVILGLSDDLEIAFAAALVEAGRRATPPIRWVFRQTNSAVVVAALHDRAIDLALTSGGAKDARIRNQSLGDSGFMTLYDAARRSHSAPIGSEEFTAREHILVSFGGLTGVTDDVLAELGRRRTVRAATSHFAALPFLLMGTDAISTIPTHAARALAAATGLGLSPCPFPYPRYSIDLSWRFDALRDPRLKAARDIVASLLRPETAFTGQR